MTTEQMRELLQQEQHVSPCGCLTLYRRGPSLIPGTFALTVLGRRRCTPHRLLRAGRLVSWLEQ